MSHASSIYKSFLPRHKTAQNSSTNTATFRQHVTFGAHVNAADVSRVQPLPNIYSLQQCMLIVYN